MPIADTEFLFALNPEDKKYDGALKVLESLKSGEIIDLVVTDTAILEYYFVLKNRKFSPVKIESLFHALNKIFKEYGIKEVNTLGKDLFLRQLEIQKSHNISFFDSLLAASAESYDKSIISDDTAYDVLKTLRRIKLSR